MVQGVGFRGARPKEARIRNRECWLIRGFGGVGLITRGFWILGPKSLYLSCVDGQVVSNNQGPEFHVECSFFKSSLNPKS